MGKVNNMMMSMATIRRSATCWNPRLFGVATPRAINQVPNSNETPGGKINNKAYSTTPKIIKEKAKEIVGEKVLEKAEDIGEKAQEVIHEAWNTTKHTAEAKIKKKAGEVLGSEISEKAENMGEKAKQAVQEAWDQTKQAAEKAAETILSKAEDSADTIKHTADSLKKTLHKK